MQDPTSIYARDDAWWPAYAPSEILPGLWQGGTEDHDVVGTPRPDGHYRRDYPFDLVVTLYADAHPVPWHVEELRFGFYDAGLAPESAERAIALARYAHSRWQQGARVLIRCQAGVNRSGLVTALTLMLDGHSAADAIALMRERRSPAVLTNADFVRWLVSEAPAILGSNRRETPWRRALGAATRTDPTRTRTGE